MSSDCSFSVSVWCIWAKGETVEDEKGLEEHTDLSLSSGNCCWKPESHGRVMEELKRLVPRPALPSSVGSRWDRWPGFLAWGRETGRRERDAAGGKVNEEEGERDSRPGWPRRGGGAARQRRWWGSRTFGPHGVTGRGHGGGERGVCVCVCVSVKERCRASCCWARWCWPWSGSPRSWSDPSVSPGGALRGSRPQRPGGPRSQLQQNRCWEVRNYWRRCRHCKRCWSTEERQPSETPPLSLLRSSGWRCWSVTASAADTPWSSALLLPTARTGFFLRHCQDEWAGKT